MTELTDFEKLVLSLVTRIHGGARFPNPVCLEYCGKFTDNARALGITGYDNFHKVKKAVFGAIKHLHAEGHLLFVRRYGYTWVVSPRTAHEAEELVEGPEPVNAPYFWDDL